MKTPGTERTRPRPLRRCVFGHWFGTSPQFWMNLQQQYELRLAEEEVRAQVTSAAAPRDGAADTKAWRNRMSRRIKRMNPKPRERDERKPREPRPLQGAQREASWATAGRQARREAAAPCASESRRGGASPKAEPAKAAPAKPVEALLPTKVQTVKVTADENNMRVDRFLEAHFPGLSFSHIQRVVRKGELRVDGKRVDSKDRLEEGQSVRIPPLKLDTPKAPNPQSEAAQKTLAALKEMTIYEDDDVLVLNKPAGLAVQGGSGMTRHIDQMLEVMRDSKGQKPRLVHRIDRETSGCLADRQDPLCRLASDRRVPFAVGAKNLLGAGAGPAEAEAGPHLDLPCQGGERGRHHHAHRPAWRRGRKPRGNLLCGGRDRRQQARPGCR